MPMSDPAYQMVYARLERRLVLVSVPNPTRTVGGDVPEGERSEAATPARAAISHPCDYASFIDVVLEGTGGISPVVYVVDSLADYDHGAIDTI